MCVCEYIYVCVNIYMCVCEYICVCVCVNIYIYMYISTSAGEMMELQKKIMEQNATVGKAWVSTTYMQQVSTLTPHTHTHTHTHTHIP